MNAMDPLQQLRDIHLPPTVGWWPLAPGWWALLALLLLLLVAGITFWLLRYRRLAYRREALALWQQINQQYQADQNNARLLADLAVLLKRTSITRYGREQAAGLAGEQWLAFLDQTGQCKDFSSGAGRVLASQRYTPQPQIDAPALLTLTLAWLNKQC